MEKQTEVLIQWTRAYFESVPEYGKAIIGISGGKDSTVTAAILVNAIGADRVICVTIPHGEQDPDCTAIMDYLNIPAENRKNIDISGMYTELMRECASSGFIDDEEDYGNVPPLVYTNTPARLRMTVLYTVAGFYPGSRVVNTCNRSEDFVGYSTKYGDAAGDFSILMNVTVREILKIGDDLGLPYEFVHKTPSDGMCGKSDEENFGFTYEEIDAYLLDYKRPSMDKLARMDRMFKQSRHKYEPMPAPKLEDIIV